MLAACTLVACTDEGGPAPPTTVPSTTSSTAGIIPSTSCREGELPFAGDGLLARGGQTDTDAERLAGLRWEAQDGCERVEIEFASAAGAPATDPPPVTVDLLRHLGVLRVEIGEAVDSTAVADALFEGTLVGAAYVVRSLRGSLFVDLHLTGPAQGRAVLLTSPGRVVVDLTPGGAQLRGTPAVADFVVLVTPFQRAVSYPLRVTGYARTFEANVLARVRKANRLEAETFTTAADYLETWGEFELSILEGPQGRIELFVGEDSPQDGVESGVTLDLVAN